MGEFIHIEASSTPKPDYPFRAYCATPNKDNPPALILLQEIFGITKQFLQPLADHYAELGYYVVVPELFWRLQEKTELNPQIEAEFNQGLDLMGRFDMDLSLKDIQNVVDFCKEHSNGKVGAMGFCMGGRLAFLSARDTSVSCAIGYYGVGLDEFVGDYKNIKNKLLLHIDEKDQFVPKEKQDIILRGLKEAQNPNI